MQNITVIFLAYPSNSGKPFIEMSNEIRPESKDAEITNFQSTCEITAEVPIVATDVSATVFIALIPAAFNHFMNFCFITSPPKFSSMY